MNPHDLLAGREAPGTDTPPAVKLELTLAARLKMLRERAGLSQREVARQLGMSASFVSQLENGKSQPSVATLYLLAQCLGVSIAELFAADQQISAPSAGGAIPDRATGTAPPPAAHGAPPPVAHRPPPASAAAREHPSRERALPALVVTRPGERHLLEMDGGVIWEQLADNTGVGLDFIQIIYPPHSTSTNDKRMLRHSGREFGYLIEGELEVTVGFETFTLRVGEAIGFDSSLPHLLANKTDRVTRGIWCVRHTY